MAPISPQRQRENAEVAAFIRELYDAAGFESWGDYARAVGKLPSTLSDWQRGENSPSGYNLLRLIRAANEREANALQEAHDRTASPLERRLAAVEERVEQTRLLVAEGFRRVLGEEL